MNAVIDQIKGHRSIRKYLNKEVPEDLLEQVLLAGTMASSSGNMQAYSIIVTKDQRIKEELMEAHFHQPMVKEAPVLVTFCADFRRMRKWLELSDAPMNFDNMMSFMIASIDATLVSQNVALAAESAGLGICYMGTTLASCDQVGKILDCPEFVVPVVGFSLGYPDEAPAERKRLPMKTLVHHEKFKDYQSSDILEAYSEREILGWKRYMEVEELREQVESSGVKNLAQIYTKLKYTRESHIGYSKTIQNYLMESGFLSSSRDFVESLS